MNEIWKQLVTQKETLAVEKLIQDSNTSMMVVKALGQRLMSSNEIFTSDYDVQILMMVSTAPFVKSEEECIQVSNIVKWGINKTDILPMVSEHKDRDLAYRCLISLSFFHSIMENRTKRHGTPSPKFYREIGIGTFKKIGYMEISEDFCKWEGYLGEISS
jgi:hypothetical protein